MNPHYDWNGKNGKMQDSVFVGMLAWFYATRIILVLIHSALAINI